MTDNILILKLNEAKYSSKYVIAQPHCFGYLRSTFFFRFVNNFLGIFTLLCRDCCFKTVYLETSTCLLHAPYKQDRNSTYRCAIWGLRNYNIFNLFSLQSQIHSNLNYIPISVTFQWRGNYFSHQRQFFLGGIIQISNFSCQKIQKCQQISQ